MNREYAQYLLKQTCQDYNLIAGDFSRTRAEMWEGFEFLKDCVAQGERVLDLGCGNGRLYKLLEKQNIDYYGVDCAEKLIDIAKFLYPEAKFQVADALSLPFPDDFFDKVFSIAVLHHIPSRELRAQFLKEAKRVLRKDGLLIITVWDLNPFKMILTKKWKRLLSFLKYTSLKMFTISKLDFKDFFVPWGKTALRYLHYFTKNELEKILRTSGFKIKEIKILKRMKSRETNILLIAIK